jgi:SAP domain
MYDIDSRFTVKNLKALCQALGIAISGTKGALQQRLRMYLDQLAGKQDVVRFNIGKTAAESERGRSYSHRPRYNAHPGRKTDFSRPNGYHPSTSASSHSTPLQTNNWGMSSLYQNIRLRLFRCGLS